MNDIRQRHPVALRGRSSQGMTLLEIVMTAAIFISAIAMTMEVMTSTKQYQAFGQTYDAVTSTGLDPVVTRISADLATSAWYFYPSEDANGSGALDLGEDIDGNGVLGTVDYTNQDNDRKMRYYPYVRSDTAAGRGAAFPARIDPTGIVDYADISPWTATRFPGISGAEVGPASALEQDQITILRETALRRHLLLTDDLALEMIRPSNELIFLRVATGPWRSDPRDADQDVPDDMVFFPGYSTDVAGNIVAAPGSRAFDWRQPDNYANLPRKSDGTESVLHLSAWADDGTGAWKHRNSIDNASPNFGKPYGSPAWGAALNVGASGPRMRIQWETKLETNMYADPSPGSDYTQPPNDLREFTYAVIPSPTGLGRLVRAHRVDAVGTPKAGNEVGNWITNPTLTSGFQIDLVLSDDVVRATWTTRRHDRSLPANVVRLRLVLARPTGESSTAGGQNQILFRISEMSFCMRSSNEYEDQKTAQGLIDTTVSNLVVPFQY